VALPAKSKTYKESGVDIELGDACSALFYNASLQTFANREGKIGVPLKSEGGFSGPLYIDDMKDSYLVKNSDGCGTKAEIAHRMGKHDTLAFDLLAMVCDDAVCIGAEPIAAVNSLDAQRLNIDVVRQLARGIIDACKEAGIAMVGGETAELGRSISGYGDSPYTWNAEVTGVVERGKLITGDKISDGDFIVAFKEKGFRSNGLSLARKILEERYGDEYHKTDFHDSSWGAALLVPSQIYTKSVLAMHGAYGKRPVVRLHGVAHITGGGIAGNLGRLIYKGGFGAKIDSPFFPCMAMRELVKIGPVELKEAYSTWNMGNGMMVITPEPDEVIAIAQKNGVTAKVAGKVTTGAKIVIASYLGDELVYYGRK